MDRRTLAVSLPTESTNPPAGGDRSCPDPETLLTVLADADSRRILAASADDAVDVSTLVETCGLATPTAYRKVRQLVDLGLLEQEVRIRPTGTNFREYDLAVTGIEVEIGDGGRPSVTYHTGGSHDDGESASPAESPEQATDANRYCDLFQAVTGRTEVVEHQQRRSRRTSAEAVDRPDDRSELWPDAGLLEAVPDPTPHETAPDSDFPETGPHTESDLSY